MRRLVGLALSGYLVIALASKLLERMGVVRCECSDDCWCKHPGLSVFRWVFPRWHRGPTSDHTHM
jgi:hypothetical protein